jgi:hypothetical protein
LSCVDQPFGVRNDESWVLSRRYRVAVFRSPNAERRTPNA